MSNSVSAAAPQAQPSLPRPAATVLLLRDGVDGIEVLLLRRHARAGFAADMWVFPGGVVDSADRQLAGECWDGIDPTALTGRFAAAADLVLGFHVAAVRETFEEAGLLLARRADGTTIDLLDGAVQQQRAHLNARGRAAAADFAPWLAEQGLVLDLGALTYSSRWVTPTAEPRRYDTCFFLAEVPPGQTVDHDRIETTDQRWVTAATALEASERGEMGLMFPTIHTLRAVAAAPSADVLREQAASQPRVDTLQPHLELDDDGRFKRLLHPHDPDYPAHLYA